MIRLVTPATLALTETVQMFNDWDYILAQHCLGPKKKEYMDRYRNPLTTKMLGGIIPDKFTYLDLVKKIQPDLIIMPYVQDDVDGTIKAFNDFIGIMPKLIREETKLIGVAQGKTWSEITLCARALMEKSDIIAYPAESTAYNFNPPLNGTAHLFSNMLGRIEAVNTITGLMAIHMLDERPIHLLGCSHPLELASYKSGESFDRIISISTGLPVIDAIEKNPWCEWGPQFHPNGKDFESKFDDYFTYDPWEFPLESEFSLAGPNEVINSIECNMKVLKSILNR
jgi:hypothetical protein